MLWRALRHIEKGFYVDIGAQNPIVDSISRSFYEQGWRGIHFEPVHQWAEMLRLDRPDETVMEVAVGASSGTTELFEIPDTGLSTGRNTYARSHLADLGFASRVIRVPCLTLDEALRDIVAGREIHWLKIDVEGMEYDVLQGWNDETIRPWVLVVEATIPTTTRLDYEAWEPLIIERGYRFVYFDGLNRFYISREHEELAPAFFAPPNVFDTVEISVEANSPWCAGIKRQLAQAETRASDAEARLQSVEISSAEAQQMLERANMQLRDELRLVQSQKESQVFDSRAANAMAQVQQLSGEIARLTSMNQAFERLANEADQQRNAVVHSTSWRITEPLRKVTARISLQTRQRLRKIAKAAYWLATPWKTASRVQFRKRLRENERREQVQIPANPKYDQQGATATTAEYSQWITEREVAEERQNITAQAVKDSGFSVAFLVALPMTARTSDLVATINSVRRQTMACWTLVIGVGSECDSQIRDALKESADAEERIRLCDSNGTTKAEILADIIQKAESTFVAILDLGDVVSEYALNDFAAVVLKDSSVDIIYSDEDVISPSGKRELPYFKPCWSPDLLYAFNYFGRLTIIRRGLIDKVGGISSNAKAAAEWDLNLRITSYTEAIRRIPRVLCHRYSNSDRDRPRPGTANAKAHARAIKNYWAEQGFEASVETQKDGTQRSTWDIVAPPLVSIIIPTKDKAELLEICVNGIFNRTEYKNWEIVIVDTGSTEPETLRLYAQWGAHPGVRIVHFTQKFNYSAACNYGASYAKGELLLFLNNDIEVVAKDWLSELVRFAMRPGVGVVGTKLRYPNGVLQHAGVVTGMHVCGLLFREANEDEWGVFGSANHPRNYLAIMGACQLVRRDVFYKIDGFDEAYEISNSDVALCIRAWRAGYRVAYTPFAQLIHHEGATRGRSNPDVDMRRTIYDIRRMGVVEDPYFHPGLSGTVGIPRLILSPDLTSVQSFEKLAAERNAVHQFSSEQELYDDYSIEVLCGAAREDILWPPQRPDKIDDKWAAIRFCVDLFRNSRALRNQFPNALSLGREGEFAAWIFSNGIETLGITEAGLKLIHDILSDDPGKRVRQCYLYRDDLRAAFSLGLLPPGRGNLFRWMMNHGRAECKLRKEEIWWFFMATAENPAAELIRTYKFTPAWQEMYPAAMTVFGRKAFATWLAERYQIAAGWVNPDTWPKELRPAQQIRLAWWTREDWRSAHPRALVSLEAARVFVTWLVAEGVSWDENVQKWLQSISIMDTAKELCQPGINIIGHFCYPSGLRTSAEAINTGLGQCGVATSLRDVRTSERDDPNHSEFFGAELYDVTLIHTQPEPFFDSVYFRANLFERAPRTYRIGYWYWELEQVPSEWSEQAKQVDELWTATSFVADALRARFDIPVKALFPGIQLGEFRKRSLADFGLVAEGKFTFLFAFHMMSVMERKNPLGLIRAFKMAFSQSDAVALVLKTSFGAAHPEKMLELRDAARGANIEIIDAIFSDDETLSLMDACNCYVSLHRSEGLGLTMGEAMLLGKPVIATRYSGNLDFMNDENSLLVDYELKEVGSGNPPYDARAHWAEPSIEHAAYLMRRLYENQEFALRLGAKAKADVTNKFSTRAAGERIKEQIERISGKIHSPQ